VALVGTGFLLLGMISFISMQLFNNEFAFYGWNLGYNPADNILSVI
jgi:hypothetical protein